jgi:hypothetical protein
LTIELTPAQGRIASLLLKITPVIRLGLQPKLKPLKIQLEVESPKDTLHFEHLTELSLSLCARPCMSRAWIMRSHQTPHGEPVRAFQSRYPINFVVKHPSLPLLEEGPALRLLKPVRGH